jgi:hypothetical protein
VTAHGRRGRWGERGQGLVEFALVLPLFMVLLLGVLEFGTAFRHHLSLEYATREGARSGAALANGGGKLGCSAGQSPQAATVDPLIIEAVERVLTSAGSPIALVDVQQIRIYKANAAGSEAGPVNVWTYTPGAGPIPSDTTTRLNFSPSSVGWSVCSRSNAVPAESIGVSISYRYAFRTGLAAMMKLIGPSTGPTLTLVDKTVMSLNPTAS